MVYIKLIFSGFILFMLLSVTNNAAAYSCYKAGTVNITIPATLSIQRDLPVGSEIATYHSSSNSTYHCSGSVTYQEFGIKGIGQNGTYSAKFDNRMIYNTNVAGVGYAIGSSMQTGCNFSTISWVNGNSKTSFDGNLNNRLLCYNPGNLVLIDAYIKAVAYITFYKTAPTGSGTIVGHVGDYILRTNKGYWFTPEVAINISSSTVKTLGCDLKSSTINVDLGRVKKKDFSGVGTTSTSDDGRVFSIALNCNTGTKVHLQLDANLQDPSPGVLALNPVTGSASGVGIQLLYKDKPVTFGTSMEIETTPTDGDYLIPLKARYYQTQANISPGIANGTASFTLSYQ